MDETARKRGWTPRDWLLAEAVRRLDEADGVAGRDDAATRAAARQPGDVETRIVHRARHCEAGRALAPAVDRVLSATRWLALAIAALGFVLGAAAAAGMRSGDATIAVSYALFVLLGVPSVLLALWAALMLAAGLRGGRGSGGVLGRALGRALQAWTYRGADGARRSALAAAVSALGRRRGGTLAAVATHAFWSAFHLGSVAWLLVLFLGLRFDFSWETTLLTGAWLVDAIHSLGTLPALLPGVDQPSPEQVATVLTDRSPPAQRRLWAGFLIGSLLVYGLAPRALLALVFAWRCRRMRIPLDLGRPGYVALVPALSETSTHAVPADRPPPLARARAPRRRGGSGPAVAVGIELDDDQPWPPPIPDALVLGRADDRRQRREVLEALGRIQPPPARIVALCSLSRTPDRGTAYFLCELAAFAPLEIRLTGRAGAEPGARIDDWRRLAGRFGLPEPLPVDTG